MSAGQKNSVAGALAAGQSAAPLAVAPPHQQTEWQVAAGAGGGRAARLQEGGELSAGRLVPPGQQPRGALPRCEYYYELTLSQLSHLTTLTTFTTLTTLTLSQLSRLSQLTLLIALIHSVFSPLVAA